MNWEKMQVLRNKQGKIKVSTKEVQDAAKSRGIFNIEAEIIKLEWNKAQHGWGRFMDEYGKKQLPKYWHKNLMAPFHKKGEQSDCGNYRYTYIPNNKIYTKIIIKTESENRRKNTRQASNFLTP